MIEDKKQPLRDNKDSRRRMAALRRRQNFLARRIRDYQGNSSSRDQIEHAALKWAIDIVENWMADDPRTAECPICGEGPLEARGYGMVCPNGHVTET